MRAWWFAVMLLACSSKRGSAPVTVTSTSAPVTVSASAPSVVASAPRVVPSWSLKFDDGQSPIRGTRHARRKCFEPYAASIHHKVQITLQLEIGAEGNVEKVTVTESNAPVVALCLQKLAKTWHAESASKGTFAIPFIFLNDETAGTYDPKPIKIEI